jgi:hypothetical protein
MDRVEIVRWLVTPAAVATLLFGLLPLYDPPVRWARRLRGDIAIAAGLPEGDEKRLLEADLERQARRLREYREVYVGWRWVRKWALVSFVGVEVVLLTLYPPFDAKLRTGEPAFGPADYMLLAGGAVQLLAFVVFFGLGLNARGRTPSEVLFFERYGRRARRAGRSRRLQRLRARRRNRGEDVRGTGSTLGFSTQVDPLGMEVREWVMRSRASDADSRQ